MDKTQKEKIRDDREERFRKDFRAGLFKNLLTGLENPFEIEKWWLNELDLAIKETEERIKNDYIEYLTARVYSRKYEGKTDFWDWKQTAEARDMETWN